MLKSSFSRGLLLAVPALASIGFVAVWAKAGAKSTIDVSVSAVERYAYGVLANARSSAGNLARIGCFASATPGATTVTCTAKDAAGTFVLCTTSSSSLISVVQGLSGDSYLGFYWDANGVCNRIEVGNQSFYAPKSL